MIAKQLQKYFNKTDLKFLMYVRLSANDDHAKFSKNSQ